MNDFGVGVVDKGYGNVSQKVRNYHLITFKSECIPFGKSQFFVTQDKPDFFNGWLSSKGVFVDSIEGVTKSVEALFTDVDRAHIVDMTFPMQSVSFVQNLIFKAK